MNMPNSVQLLFHFDSRGSVHYYGFDPSAGYVVSFKNQEHAFNWLRKFYQLITGNPLFPDYEAIPSIWRHNNAS